MSTYGAQVREARLAAGLTQRALATRSGVAQPHLARIETGAVRPTTATVEKLLRAARPRPSELLAGRHDEIVEVVRQERGTGLVEVFGSVARGSDTEASDLDLLVEFEPGADLFNVVALEQRLGDLLGCRVDVVPRSSSGRAARNARRGAVPLP